ncbi:MAG: alkaline phosphatase family protein [Phycisphaeraceae bacterium]|nr:alkaline phosphatase family protein [Phycisphaeraceae bacterium]
MPQPLALILIVGLNEQLLGHAPFLRQWSARWRIRTLVPDFPAVTCTVQTSLLTGVRPREHGIVGNGWYDRRLAEIHFWKQSSHLVEAPRLWDTLKGRDPSMTCAQLFWWYNMHASVDYAATPRPQYRADGRKIPDIHARPMILRDELQEKLGPFPLFKFWGPLADIEASRWIVDASLHVQQRYAPNLMTVYLPHMDYCLQKLGPEHEQVASQMSAIDHEAARLIQHLEQRGFQVVVLSEYGIEPVRQPVYPNRLLNEMGLLRYRVEAGRWYLDPGECEAFAVCDHQVAHIYVKDTDVQPRVAARLRTLAGVERVLDRHGQAELGLDHHRAGDLVLIAESGCWFSYYYWPDDRLAPDYARTVDIHRKPGYDPVELFIDPKLRLGKLGVAAKVLKRKLGFRGLLDVIPLDATLVQGSHGRVDIDPRYQPMVIWPDSFDGKAQPTSRSTGSPYPPINCRQVHHALLRNLMA